MKVQSQIPYHSLQSVNTGLSSAQLRNEEDMLIMNMEFETKGVQSQLATVHQYILNCGILNFVTPTHPTLVNHLTYSHQAPSTLRV